MRKLLVCALIVLALSGCGEEIDSGVVIDKRHEGATTWVQMMPMHIYNGKTTTTMYIPYIIHDDEDFIVVIQGEDAKHRLVKRTVYLHSRDQWEAIAIGDIISKQSTAWDTSDGHAKTGRDD